MNISEVGGRGICGYEIDVLYDLNSPIPRDHINNAKAFYIAKTLR